MQDKAKTMEISPNILRDLEERKNNAVLSGTTATEERKEGFNMGYNFSPIMPPIMIEADPHKPSGGAMFFDFFLKVAVHTAIFLTPLLFFISSDVVNLPKQFLLSTLALVGLVSWIGKIVVSGRFEWRKNIILWPMLLVALVAVFGSVFSSSFWVSFLGDSGRYVSAGLSILSYLVIALIAFQNFNKKDVSIAGILWVASSFVAGGFALLQFFGLHLISADPYKIRTFNTVGSPFALALFFLSVSPFLWCLIQSKISKKIKIALSLVLLLQVVVSVFVDFKTGWIGLIVASLFLLLMNFKKREEGGVTGGMGGYYQQKVLLPLIVIIFSVLMWFINTPQIKDFNMPAEVNPSQRASFDILAKNWREKPVFGSGLETYPYVYAKFKDVSLNQTNYWGVNFNNSTSGIITWATTTGIFGTVSLLAFILVFFVYAVRRSKLSEFQLGILTSWVFILTTKFFYAESFPLEFMFWFLPVLFMLQRDEGGEMGWSYRFQQGSVKTLSVFFVLLVLLGGTLGGLYFSIRRWMAEDNFVKVVTASNATKPEEAVKKRDEVLNGLYSSITDNPYEVRYYRALSQVLFQKLADVFNEINARSAETRQPKPEESTLIQNLTIRVVNSVQQAGKLDPNNVDIMLDTAESYKNLVALVQGSDDLAIQSYEKAMSLEPINPFIKTQLGQLYLIKSNLFNQQAVADKDMVVKSKNVFEEALKLNANYANARYFFALIQDKEGSKKEALENFKILKSTNPDNKLIAQIIANLEQGLPALGVPPQPATPPDSPKAEETKGVPAK